MKTKFEFTDLTEELKIAEAMARDVLKERHLAAHPEDRARLEAQEAIVATLGPDEELEPVPEGMSVDELHRTGFVRQKRKRHPRRFAIDENAVEPSTALTVNSTPEEKAAWYAFWRKSFWSRAR